MSKNIVRVVSDNPKIVNIELGCGCDEFGTLFFSKSFLTDVRDPNRGCAASTSDFYFKADANEISNHVPNDRFELVICCNPHEYGFKTPLESFMILEQFKNILVPKKGKVLLIGSTINPYCRHKKIKKFISEFNEENKTEFKIGDPGVLSQKYSNFIFKDKNGVIVKPNTEMVIEN